MELHQLRYLRAAVRLGSITRAAEEVHVAQPAVSRQVQLLEREVGVPLFHRVGRGIIPTEAGLRLAECATRVLDDIAATTAALAPDDLALPHHLSFCATETVTEHVLPGALAALRSSRPNCTVSAEMLGTDDAVGRVLADAADFAVVVLPLADARLEVNELFEEEVRLVVPPHHAWAARSSPVPLAEALADPSLLVSMRGHGLRAQLDAAAAAVAATVRPGIELRSQQALLAMVAAGAGVCFAPAMAVRGRGDIAVLEVAPKLTRRIGSVRRKGRHVGPAAHELLGLIATAGG